MFTRRLALFTTVILGTACTEGGSFLDVEFDRLDVQLTISGTSMKSYGLHQESHNGVTPCAGRFLFRLLK